MGMFNYLYFKETCPICKKMENMEAEIKIGKLDLDIYKIGDIINWGDVKKRPLNGNFIGEGYVVCENCHKDFWIDVMILNDVIVNVQVKSKNGYIN